MQTTNFITLFNELLAALNQQYPEASLQFNFTTWVDTDVPQTGTGPIQPHYPYLWVNDQIYLMAYHTKVDRKPDQDNGIAYFGNTINLEPTDSDEIEDAGLDTIELTTPSGLTIIIAEDF